MVRLLNVAIRVLVLKIIASFSDLLASFPKHLSSPWQVLLTAHAAKSLQDSYRMDTDPLKSYVDIILIPAGFHAFD